MVSKLKRFFRETLYPRSPDGEILKGTVVNQSDVNQIVAVFSALFTLINTLLLKKQQRMMTADRDSPNGE